MKLGKILVPLDGSPLAEGALARVVELAADRPQTSVVLLRATEASALAEFHPIQAQVAAVEEAQGYLDAVAARLRSQGLKTVTTSVWYGTPAASIVEAAAVGGVDLIVMSTHGRSGLGRLIMGSVAESVLRGTKTPILLLHAEGTPVEAPVGTGREVRPEVSHV